MIAGPQIYLSLWLETRPIHGKNLMREWNLLHIQTCIHVLFLEPLKSFCSLSHAQLLFCRMCWQWLSCFTRFWVGIQRENNLLQRTCCHNISYPYEIKTSGLIIRKSVKNLFEAFKVLFHGSIFPLCWLSAGSIFYPYSCTRNLSRKSCCPQIRFGNFSLLTQAWDMISL